MYLLIVAIFCFTILPISLCYDDVDHFMTTREVQMTFQTSKNSVPTHELITIERFPQATYSPVTGKRIVPSDGRMWIRTLASNIHLLLRPSDSSLIEENTPVYHTEFSSTKPENVNFVRQNRATRNIGRRYVDDANQASLLIDEDASGKTRVNGYIASKGITIRSLPDHIVKEYLRTRRSIDDSEYHSSNLSYHVAFTTPENVEKQQSVYPFNATSLRDRIERSASYSDEIPYQLTLELLVVVENSLYEKYGRNTESCLQYLAAFWNAVELKFRNIENPQLRLHIHSIIIETQPNDMTYLTNNVWRDGSFKSNLLLGSASTYFYNIKDSFSLNDYDVSVTMLSKDMRDVENSFETIAGRAFIGHACTRTASATKGVALIVDNGVFSGVLPAAHELGHTLAMRHDDGVQVTCEKKDGYIMAKSTKAGPNSSSFSTCSIESFNTALHNQRFKCLYNRPTTAGNSMSRTLPGQIKSLDEQCVAQNRQRSCTGSELDNYDYCKSLRCISMGEYCFSIDVPALEGTPCGSSPNMYCLRNRCTLVPAS